jgi:hypothetical protein
MLYCSKGNSGIQGMDWYRFNKIPGWKEDENTDNVKYVVRMMYAAGIFNQENG